MKTIPALLLASVMVVGVGPNALSSDNSSVPPGISADNWIALGADAGFVVTNGDSLIGSADSAGVAKGYFMLRRAGIWLRIDTTPDFGAFGSRH